MDKREIQKAFDTCLEDIKFTSAHRRAVFTRIEKEKKKKRITWQQLTAVGVLAAGLAIVLFVQMPQSDRVVTPATQGEGAGAIATQGSDIFELVLLSEEDAIAIAKEKLAEDRLWQAAFTAAAIDEGEDWLVSVLLAEEVHYEVRVNKETGDAEITYRKPVLAEEDPSEEELAMQARLEAYESYVREMTEKKGDSRFWTLDEKAKRTALAKDADLLGTQWDALPGGTDISEKEAIEAARQALSANSAYAGLDVNSMHAYASFLEDVAGKTVWSIILMESADAEKGICVDIPSKINPVIQQKPVENEALAMYYNPDGGQYYHSDQNCPSVRDKYLPLAPIEDESLVAELKACEHCVKK